VPNQYFRSRAVDAVRRAVAEFNTAAQIDHMGMRGSAREHAIHALFREFLPTGIEQGKGKIVDHLGNQSAETDLLLYVPRILPPALISSSEGIFPIESCIYAFEIKSRSTSETIQDAITKATRLTTLRYLDGRIGTGTTSMIPFVYLAYSSDLSGPTTELERYLSLRPPVFANERIPVISIICVIGKGYWYFNSSARRWEFRRPTAEFDEVVGLLAGVSNTVASTINRRGNPPFGQYLFDERFEIAALEDKEHRVLANVSTSNIEN
jgi:hypothetical protein